MTAKEQAEQVERVIGLLRTAESKLRLVKEDTPWMPVKKQAMRSVNQVISTRINAQELLALLNDRAYVEAQKEAKQ